MTTYTVVNNDGARSRLRFAGWRNGRAYLVSDGAASYLADPYSGGVYGVESTAGISLRLVEGAWRRLHAEAERLRTLSEASHG
jgi:hypothetical protein